MIQLYDQTTFSDRDAGTHGDCCRACVATILQIDPDQIPHPINEVGDPKGEWNPQFHAYLRSIGYSLRIVDYGAEGDMMNPDLRDANWGGAVIPRIVMAAGPSWRGPWMHAVVWDRYAGRMIHDPHPSRAGLIEILALDYLGVYPCPETQGRLGELLEGKA